MPPKSRPLVETEFQLKEALVAASPRLSPPPGRWTGLVIHGAIMALFLALLARAFVPDGLFAWSIGLVYVGYDTALVVFVFWQTLDIRGRKRPPSPGERPPQRLAVVVAAYNEASVLPETLGALFRQTAPPDLIVVADDGSSDGTVALMDRMFDLAPPETGSLSAPSPRHATLRWLRLPHDGKPAALNRALLRIEAEIVVTVDGDTLLDENAIGAMRDAFAADPALVAATGVLRPVCGRTVGGRIFQWFQTYEYVRNFLSRYAWMRMDSLLLISGAFAGFRADAVRAVGGFDPACLTEDYELIHRLRRYGVLHGLGWTTAVVGGSQALTEAPGSLGTFLRQRRRWFGGFLQTQFWYRDMIGNGVYGALGRLMLPVKAADTMQPFYGLAAFALLLFYLATGRLAVVGPILGIMGGKLLIDMAFHLWSIRLYRRWTGTEVGFGAGFLAALVEPFSFQLLRHLGAALGWLVFLTGQRSWGVQRRAGLVAAYRPADQPIAPAPVGTES